MSRIRFDQLNDYERACKARYDIFRKGGIGQTDAACQALAAMFPTARTPAFVSWLSSGTLHLDAHHQVRRNAPPPAKPIMSADEVWGSPLRRENR